MPALGRSKIRSSQDPWMLVAHLSGQTLNASFHLSLGMALWGPDCDHLFLLKDGETEAQAGKASSPRRHRASQCQLQGLIPER